MTELKGTNRDALKAAMIKEEKRLRKVFDALPSNKKAIVDGLIVEAARLRALLDALYADIEEHGATELFQQSEKVPPYTKERPEAKQYKDFNKNYQSIIKQLTDLAPAEAKAGGKLEAFLDE